MNRVRTTWFLAWMAAGPACADRPDIPGEECHGQAGDLPKDVDREATGVVKQGLRFDQTKYTCVEEDLAGACALVGFAEGCPTLATAYEEYWESYAFCIEETGAEWQVVSHSCAGAGSTGNNESTPCPGDGLYQGTPRAYKYLYFPLPGDDREVEAVALSQVELDEYWCCSGTVVQQRWIGREVHCTTWVLSADIYPYHPY